MACKPTVKNIYDYINSIAPFEKQCEWDNSGLVVGNLNAQIGKIGVVLDITNETVSYAAENGIDLIISHHPVIFRATKTFLADDPAYMLARSGISAICAHTSLDIAKGGVNDALASALGFENVCNLTEDGETAMIRVVQTEKMSGENLAKLVSQKLATCTTVADSGKEITKIALCGGAGGDFLGDVINAGCDAYITGEAKHHEFLQALESGITLIAAGHFETENIICQFITEYLEDAFDGLNVIPSDAEPYLWG